MPEAQASQRVGAGGETLKEAHKARDVRSSNITAAKGPSSRHPQLPSLTSVPLPLVSLAIADAIRTSLGPRGMDKMIQQEDGEVVISNDGATIMSRMQVRDGLVCSHASASG